MSLSLRLILLILGVVLSMLLAGAFLALDHARKTVANETESSARLTLQLLSAAIISGQADNPSSAQQILIRHLQELNKTRHLNIALLRHDGLVIQPASQSREGRQNAAPRWFSHLISPAPSEYRRRFTNPGAPPTEILIVPNPDDEITEVWTETGAILGLILLFTALSLILITWVIRRSLKPLKEISAGLTVIQDGDYQTRLPQFKLPELDSLSTRFNHMAKVLEEQQQENRRLSKRALEIQEQERRHLARELHDELGQSISAIKAVAVSLEQKQEQEAGKNTSAKAIIQISDHIYGVVRDMMNQLRPVVLDELGLVTALERLVDNWNTHHEDTFCALSLDPSLTDLSEEINIQLYRIVQEALTNVAKHAGASEVKVNLKRAATDKLKLTINDNGKGFAASTKQTGMGLPGMRERVHSIDGKMSLESQPEHGVKIAITI